ncbi:MAG: polysaccharide biosynthesis C-terminal domain-containing protein [Bacteroidota bacterium]
MTLPARFLKAFAWNHIGKLVEACLVYVFSVMIARKLGAFRNGEFALFLSITQMLVIISSLGMENSITAYYPRLLEELSSEHIGGVFRQMLLFRGASILGLGLIASLLKDLFSSWFSLPKQIIDVWYVMILYFVLRSFISLLTSYQIAKIQTRAIALINIIIRSAELIGGYILLAGGHGLRTIFIFLVITACGQAAGYLISLEELFYGKSKETSLQPLHDLSLRFWLNSVVEFILGKQTDILLLSFFLIGTQFIGYYDVAFSFVTLINIGLTTGMYGLVVRSFSTMEITRRESLPAYWEFLTHAVILTVVPIFVFTCCFATHILPHIYSQKYQSSIPLFQILSVFMISTRLLGGGIAGDYLQASRNINLLIKSSVISGITNLVLALILIPRFGVLGAVYATGFSALVLAGLQGYYSGALLRIHLPISTGAIAILASGMSVLVVEMLYPMVLNHNIIAAALSFEIIFLIFCYFIKPLPMKDMEFLDFLPGTLKKYFTLLMRYPFHIKSKDGNKYHLTDRRKIAYWWIPESAILLDLWSSDNEFHTAFQSKVETINRYNEDVEILYSLDSKTRKRSSSVIIKQPLPYETASMDSVLFIDDFKPSRCEAEILNEISRVLKPGGTLILSVPNRRKFKRLNSKNINMMSREHLSRPLEHVPSSDSQLMNLIGSRFRFVRQHRGGLILFPIARFLNSKSEISRHPRLSGIIQTIGDWDYTISWGSLSSNIIVQFEKF